MGRLQRLEISNFKSYRNTQRIEFGDANFTSIIGPNGAGKSNMMDAISFVLGIKSSQLRSSQLRDLIYRGRVLAGHSPNVPTGKDATTASVTAVYVKDDGSELQLKRTITAQGASEYRLNGRTVTAADYTAALEKENILIKARNFLVFQGDVEAIAAQSPKDLTRLIEQISGSIEYKQQYEQLKLEQERATEASTVAFTKKRGFNAEIKQYQEQKVEVENYERKLREREAAVTAHVLWRLCHLGAAVERGQTDVESARREARELDREHAAAQATLDEARTRQAQVARVLQRHERAIRKDEKLVEDKQTALLPVDEKLRVIRQNRVRHEARRAEIEVDQKRQAAAAAQLRKDLANVDRAVAKFEAEQRELARASGIALTDADMAEHARLTEAFNSRAAGERLRLENFLRQQRIDDEALARARDKADELDAHKKRLAAEIAELGSKQAQASAHVNRELEELEAKKQALNELVARRLRVQAKETELNEKLQRCLAELVEMNADRRESEKEARLRETVASLKRVIPGVHGRVSDLCKPKQKKYETAMSTVLGRNFDAIVVDTQKTATYCITYIREQRAGVATFIPLDSVVNTPVMASIRGMNKNVRLAIDIIDFDPVNERAMQYVCGSSVVCEDLDTAKHLRWERGVDVKAVTLDGTVIHKGGLMTGGRNNSSNSKRWEDQAAKGLTKLKESLLDQLAELAREKGHGSEEETLGGELSGLEMKLNSSRDELNNLRRTLRTREDEVKHIDGQLKDVRPRLKALQAQHKTTEGQVAELTRSVRAIEDAVFADFCRRIGVASIREYDERQGALAQRAAQRRLELTTQKTRVQNQLQFEEERLAETEQRIANITAGLEREDAQLVQLEAEKAALQDEIDVLQAQLASTRAEFRTHKAAADEVAESVAQARGAVAAASKAVDQASKRVLSLQEELEQAAAQRLSTLRNCKIEGVRVPLLAGSLADIPMGEDAVAGNMMDLDDDAGPTQVRRATDDYGVVVDFASLPDELRTNGADDVEDGLLERVQALSAELEKMTPNMKVLERLDEVEHRLHDTEKEFEAVRREAKRARDQFNEVKERRSSLFNAAYEHISGRIDEIYKELTRSNALTLGGNAYLTAEDLDEPYLEGIKYHAMPPMKRFRDMDLLSGGEKTMAALALLFAIHSFRPSPFFVLDEVDAALDNANVAKIAKYIQGHASADFQFIVISLKNTLYQHSNALVGIYRAQDENSSRALTLDLQPYAAEPARAA
ncbi:RecF/RecN/SMC protein [Dipodascopsis tothii]|uniref:RecF/RecN/SMC protein n=1 Tax=Dipodascopsis tothii TaxID=44089 RepID=UPI0034CF2934